MNIKQILNSYNLSLEIRRTMEPVWAELESMFDLSCQNFSNVNMEDGNLSIANKKIKNYISRPRSIWRKSASLIFGELVTLENQLLHIYPTDRKSSQDGEVTETFTEISRIVQEYVNSSFSNFPTLSYEFILECMLMGTAVMYIEEDFGDNEPVKFQNIPLREFSFTVNTSNIMEKAFRTVDMYPQDMIEMFGANAPDVCFTNVERGILDKIKVVNCVYKDRTKKRKPYVGIWFLPDDGIILKTSSFYEQPYKIHRWDTRTGSIYGYSPAMVAIESVRLLNLCAEAFIINTKRAAAPPILIGDDGIINPQQLQGNSIVYGGLDSATGTERVKPLFLNGDITANIAGMDYATKEIREVFFLDDLMFGEVQTMSATESSLRRDQQMRVASPTVLKLVHTFRDIFERVFFILLRNKKLPQIPESVAGKDFNIELLSPLAKMAKYGHLSGINRAISNLAPFIQIDPSVIDLIDTDKVSRHIVDASGAPLDFIRKNSEIDAIRQEKQQQAAEDRDMNQLQMLSGLTKDTRKTPQSLQPI